MTPAFRRDRLTWTAYVLLGFFAYLQAAPGLVIVHLRAELGLSYAVGGLHVAAFAGGAMIAGVLAGRLERVLGRRRLLWSAATVMGLAAVGLTAGRVAGVTLGSVLAMGFGGGLLLVTIQAVLADHHGRFRSVALAEANVAASISYLALTGVLSLAAVLHLGWRPALLVCLAVPVVGYVLNRRLTIEAPAPSRQAHGPLPGAFWVTVAMLFCMTAAEWCIGGWGASFVATAAGVPTDTAVALMAGYFGGVLGGRVAGSRLARRHDPSRLLASALVVATAGFGVLWPATAPLPALLGLTLLGVGLGNLFPMGMALAVSLAPDRAALASGRAVSVTSSAILLAPFTVGALADATSLKAALTVVPALLVLAAAGLVLVHRGRARLRARPQPASAPAEDR